MNEKENKVGVTHNQGHNGERISYEVKSNVNNNYTEKIEPPIKMRPGGLYFGFSSRISCYVVVMLIALLAAIFFALNSVKYEEAKTVGYREKSNLDYQVCLKENDFYAEECLGKNMQYVASLIDKVALDFNYDFEIDQKADLDFSYSIVGDLIIANKAGDSIYFQKKYELLKPTKSSMKNEKDHTISENIKIDYSYYNELANDFKVSYGLDTNSYLKVYFRIQKENQNDNITLNVNNVEDMTITIPLSERSINIKMDYEDINETNQLLMKAGLNITKVGYFTVAIVFLIIFLIFTFKLIRLLSVLRRKNSNYDKYINKLLNEYDRLIVETSSSPYIKKANIIKVGRFEELLDVRDNLKIPIMYYNVTNHLKCYFYIKNNNDVYILTIKAVDLE